VWNRSRLVLFACAALLSRCSSLDVDSIRYACEDDGSCGQGWRCARATDQASGVCEPLTAVDSSTKPVDVGGAADDGSDAMPDAEPDVGEQPDVAVGCTPEACDDGNPCTFDGCEDGACAHASLPGLCEDGDLCTTGDTCQDRVCTAGDPVDCDDGDPCTGDACLPEVGCQHTPIRGCGSR
jgi:hypothetical protein